MGWSDLTRDIQLRIFRHLIYQTGGSFPDPVPDSRKTAIDVTCLSKATYNVAVQALWEHVSIFEELDPGNPKHGRALDRLLWTVDHGDPAVQVDGSKPAAQYIESINYITKWKVSAFSRAQRDLAHLIRMCASNLKRLRLDGVVFHLPTFFTTLTKDLSLTELRLENVDKTLLAEDLTTVLCSQPKLKSFQLGSDCFEDDDGNYVIKQRDNKDSAKQTCAELVSLRLSACSSSHISTFLSRCDFPALKKVDICLPNTNEGAARPYKLDFISALPKSLTHFALMEDSEVYNTTSIEWPDVAKDLPQLQHLSTNLSTSAFCMTSSPFPKLSDLKLIYPHPSPLAFFRCLKDNAWMPDLKHLALENWSGSPCVEHLTVEGVGYIKEKGDVPGMLILHQYDMLDQQAVQLGKSRKQPLRVSMNST